MELSKVQSMIQERYGDRDAARGIPGTFMWFMEEVGELAEALQGGDTDLQTEEFGDVLAWLATLANIAGVDLDHAIAKYADGCPSCGHPRCDCSTKT